MNKTQKSNLSLRKLVLAAMVAAPLATLPVPLWALPATQTLLNGQVNSTTTGVTLTSVSGTQVDISSTATNSIIHWVDFGGGGMTINGGDLVLFSLPGNTSAVLNVVDQPTGHVTNTTIGGSIQSNGSIYILNQNGIVVSSGASITSTGGAVGLSTVPEADFFFANNGSLSYSGTASNPVEVDGGATISATSGTGNVYLVGKSAQIAGTIDAGMLTITAQNGNVDLAKNGALSVSPTGKVGQLNVTIGSGPTNNITLDTSNLGNAVTVNGGSASFTTAGGTLTQSATGTLTVGSTAGSSSDGALTINTGSGAVTLNNANAVTGKSLNTTLTSAGATILTSSANNVSVGGTSSSTVTVSAAGDLTLNTLTTGGTAGTTTLSATTSGGSIKSGGTVTTAGKISLSAATPGKTIKYQGAGDLLFAGITNDNTNTGSGVTLTSTTGKVTIPTITTSNLTVTSATDIVQSGVITSNMAGAGVLSLTAGGGIDLTSQATNSFNTLTVTNAPNGAKVVDAGGVTLKGTSTTSDLKVTAGGAVVIGSSSTDTNTVGGLLTIDTSAANANISETTNNLTATNGLTLAAGTGAITVDGATHNAVGLNNQFGVLTITSGGTVKVFQKTAMNLGNVTTTGNARFYSANSITESGQITMPGATVLELGAGTAATPGNITLSNSANSIGATIALLDDANLLQNNAAGTANVGNYLANNLTIVNASSTTLAAISNAYGTGLPGALSVTATGGSNSITLGSPTIVTGAVTLSAPGAITASSTSNLISTLNLTSSGAISVVSSTAMTVNGTLSTGANSVSISSNGVTSNALTIGSFSDSNNSGTVTFGGKGISDSVAGISIYGPVKFNSTGGITVNKSGHSFGGVTLVAGGNSDITFTEAGTLVLKGIQLGGSKSNVTVTSTAGDITQDATGTGFTGGDSSKTATFKASTGNVTLNDNTHNAFSDVLAVTAGGNISVNTTGDLALASFVGSNTTGVTTTGKITQSTGTIWSYGTTSFTSSGAGKDISITKSGNNFGGLVLTSNGGNISLTESGTLNVKSAQTGAGNLTLTSENSDIIDTVDATVTNNNLVSTGTATFNTSKGNVVLDNPGNNYATAAFNTSGNVSITQSTTDLTLGASSIGGALTITNKASTKSILQSGAVLVTGAATFNTTNGAVTLSNNSNQFGPVRFIVANNSTINEATTFNLASGSVASGPVTINTNGGFVTSGVGGSTFTNNLTINAIGTIVPSQGSLLVTGVFTVYSNATKDLSALSLSGNLAGNAPVNQGTGTYVAPSP